MVNTWYEGAGEEHTVALKELTFTDTNQGRGHQTPVMSESKLTQGRDHQKPVMSESQSVSVCPWCMDYLSNL